MSSLNTTVNVMFKFKMMVSDFVRVESCHSSRSIPVVSLAEGTAQQKIN